MVEGKGRETARKGGFLGEKSNSEQPSREDAKVNAEDTHLCREKARLPALARVCPPSLAFYGGRTRGPESIRGSQRVPTGRGLSRVITVVSRLRGGLSRLEPDKAA
jgi:hypothetical protein